MCATSIESVKLQDPFNEILSSFRLQHFFFIKQDTRTVIKKNPLKETLRDSSMDSGSQQSSQCKIRRENSFCLCFFFHYFSYATFIFRR